MLLHFPMDTMFNAVKIITLCLTGLITVGCASYIEDRVSLLSDSIKFSIQESQDIQTARTGLPAYLFFMEGMSRQAPDNPDLALKTAALISAYVSLLEEEAASKGYLLSRSLRKAEQAVCLIKLNLCDAHLLPHKKFLASLNEFSESEAEYLYVLGMAWAGVIQFEANNFERLMEIPKVKALMTRVIQLDPDFERGQPHLFLGVLETILPDHMGGHSDQGKYHFLRAKELSNEENLMANVLYAERYAQPRFEKKLFETLLNEVLMNDIKDSMFSLSNQIAQVKAKTLLEKGKEYFS